MTISGEAKALLSIALVTILILVGGVYFLTKSNPKTSSTQPNSSSQKVSQKQLIKEDSRKIGTSSAKVTIVEFLDYECEACGAAHPTVKQVLDEYEGKVNYVVRHFPNHFNSIRAGNAVEEAGEQGKYWEMHNKLFETQQEWAEQRVPQTDIFVGYAEELGLDSEKVRQAIETNKFTKKLNRDKQEAISIGVNATPTFYINGVQYVGILPINEFQRIIDQELK